MQKKRKENETLPGMAAQHDGGGDGTEEGLRQAVERYRALLEANCHRVWWVNPDGEPGEGVGWWSEITGQTNEEARYPGWLDAVHPDDREKVRQNWEESFSRTTPYHMIFRARTPDGSYVTLSVRAVPLWNEDGSVREWAGTCDNITAQKEAERELERSRKMYADLVNTVEGIVWEADPNTFCFSFVSPQAERILGYPLAKWFDDPDFWPSLIHPDDRQATINYCLKTTAELRDHDFEYRMRAADGRYLWMHDLVSVYAEDGVPVLLRGLMVDITEQKRLQEQLLHAQKMESIGRLAGGVAHDFNNLLTAILGFTDLAEVNLPENHPVHEMLGMIRQASERASGLTDQLLTFARKQVISPQILDMNALITRVHGLLKRLITENIDLRTLLAEDIGHVRADAGQLEQVLINLAVNARDAMPCGGALTIETHNVTLDAEYVRLHPGVKAGNYVQLIVSDTGIGIEESVRSRIFEPFFTTKADSKGTGLGLATCLGIVEQSGGHIRVYSEPGHGAAFKVYLPRVSGEKAAPPPTEEMSGGDGSETILVVEDEALVREIAVTVLRAHGYTTLEAETGVDALRVVEEYPGTIHMLLTDIIMPQMGGVELAERMAQLRPDIRILYVSGYSEHSLVHHGIAEDRIAFLSKPYSPAQLARKVRHTLDAKS